MASAPLTLGRGPIFEIVVTDGIARCSVVNRPDITPEEGARCAGEMHQILEREVLSAESPYRGLVFDVRRGPDVFGPKTRAALEQLFRTAERVRKPIAVRIGGAAIQRLQFTNLCVECAPTLGKVVSTTEEEDWARRHAVTERPQ